MSKKNPSVILCAEYYLASIRFQSVVYVYIQVKYPSVIVKAAFLVLHTSVYGSDVVGKVKDRLFHISLLLHFRYRHRLHLSFIMAGKVQCLDEWKMKAKILSVLDWR